MFLAWATLASGKLNSMVGTLAKSPAIFAFHDTEDIGVGARQDALAMRKADFSETSFFTKDADRSINR